MVVRTVGFHTVGTVLTGFGFEEIRMVFLLLPAVGERTVILVGAALRVRANEVVDMPLGAHLARVRENGWFAAEILPVMCIYAYFSVVIILAVGAPDSLKVEHVEVHINFILLNHLNG